MSTIAIVGKGARKPIDADEVWGFNPPGGIFDKTHFGDYTRWFELHTLDTHMIRRPEYVTVFLAGITEHNGIPVEVMDVEGLDRLRGGIPSVELNVGLFPEQEIRDAFPRGWYHCSSVDWLIARAIIELVPNNGPGESYGDGHTIILAGMNFGGNEPDSSRACCEYWAGVAEGAGIEVRVEQSKCLLINAQRETWDGEWSETREAYGLDVANFDGGER